MEDTPQRAAVYGRQSANRQKSIADQIRECTGDAERLGWTITDTYSDGSSASRYARRTRDDWARLLVDLEAGTFDVLVLWESSRGSREPVDWFRLLSTCRERSIRIHVVSHSRTYDLANGRDWRTLAEDGVDAAYESEKTSVRVLRGHAAAAAAGHPPMGPPPYGYRRVYDPHTGKLTGQEPDPATSEIAKEIIERVAARMPISVVVDDLNKRGVLPPEVNGKRGKCWYRQRVRDIATNPAYIGQRVHHGVTHDGAWKGIVDPDVFHAAGRILADPTRLVPGRPGRLQHLLSGVAECWRGTDDGHELTARSTYYVCRRGCLGVRRQPLDDLVRDTILARLTKPDAYKRLRQAGADDDRAVLAARNEAAKLTATLDGWRRSAARGQTSPESLAVIEAELTAQIRAALRRADAAIPQALRMLVEPGGDVWERWAEMLVPARRDVVAALLLVVVHPSGRNAYRPVQERVDISWRRLS